MTLSRKGTCQKSACKENKKSDILGGPDVLMWEKGEFRGQREKVKSLPEEERSKGL